MQARRPMSSVPVVSSLPPRGYPAMMPTMMPTMARSNYGTMHRLTPNMYGGRIEFLPAETPAASVPELKKSWKAGKGPAKDAPAEDAASAGDAGGGIVSKAMNAVHTVENKVEDAVHAVEDK